jgi:S1-C subfamily serine protease
LGDDAAPATIARVKHSIVAIGTFQPTRSPAFSFHGTGFVVGDGLHIITNEHVVPKSLNTERNEGLAITIRLADGSLEVRSARVLASDATHDLAVLTIPGKPLPALPLADSDRVREGEVYLFTGFPLGAVLGLYPVTHRTMIASITPIAIAAAKGAELDARTLRRLAAGSFDVFQLDGTAYPGNSGSPVYRPDTGEVIGVVNSVLVKATKEALLSSPSGITYAIPSSRLKPFLENR